MNKPTKILILFFLALLPAVGFASEHEEASQAKKETFDAGKFIFGHIRDGYGWHLTSWDGHEITIPLPVIVRGKTSGWHVFMSSKFEHGHATCKGFQISQSKDHPGKIVEIINGEELRPLDLSITKNALSIMISGIILLAIFLTIARSYKKKPMAAPGGFRAAIEVVVLFVLNEVIKPCIGKNYARYVPYLLTVFFFILLNNIMGIIPIFPGGATVTGNIAVTMVLAVFTFLFVNIFGTKEYWKDIFLVPAAPAWLKLPLPIMPLLEFVGIISKPFALMIRLFANMLAGHIIALVFMALIFIFGSVSPYVGSGVGVFSILFAICMNILEILVIFIQAYVFTLLSSVFIGLSQLEPHVEHKH